MSKKKKKVSITAQIAEKLLWTLSLKKDFETVENANKYLEKRYEKNNENIKLPLMKYKPKLFEHNNSELYVYNYFKKSEKLIVYLHGGSFNSGPIRYHFKFLETLHKKTKTPIIMPLYPKAPNYYYLDAYEMLDKLYEDICKLNYQEIILMGDSAGGGLAASFYQRLAESNYKLPKKLILLSPWVDLTMANPDIDLLEDVDPLISKIGLLEMSKAWGREANLKDYLLSPTFGKLNNFPETTIFVGTHEIFLPDIRLFNEKLKNAGIKVNYYEYFKMNHVFVLYPISEAKKALRQIINNIKK